MVMPKDIDAGRLLECLLGLDGIYAKQCLHLHRNIQRAIRLTFLRKSLGGQEDGRKQSPALGDKLMQPLDRADLQVGKRRQYQQFVGFVADSDLAFRNLGASQNIFIEMGAETTLSAPGASR